MFAVVTPEQVKLSPGTIVRLPGSWADYRAIVAQLGDRQTPRIKYRHGEILLMSPLPIHGRQADGIANVVKVLLEHFQLDYTSFTPIIMELPEESGIEPDYCFYIDHWAAIAGKDRIIWGTDPAPDLVIEINVTSYTDVNDYAPYEVPEVWLYRKQQLLVYEWQNQAYVQRSNSRYFPGIDLASAVSMFLDTTFTSNTSAAMRELRQILNNLDARFQESSTSQKAALLLELP
jgi:Uma2 family endonuclease